jgi:hypothetical protein
MWLVLAFGFNSSFVGSGYISKVKSVRFYHPGKYELGDIWGSIKQNYTFISANLD